MKSWLSVHIHWSGNRDDLILDMVEPAVATWMRAGHVERFFFIRYDEGGAHVRLRLRGDDTELAKVAPLLDHALAEFSRSNARAYWQRVDYVPEVDRYGGPEGVAVSEQHFWRSSEIALRALDHCRDRPARLHGLALKLMLATPMAEDADPDLMAAFFDLYHKRTLETCVLDPGERLATVRRFEETCARYDHAGLELGSRFAQVLHTRCGSAAEPVVADWLSDLRRARSALRALDANGKFVLPEELIRIFVVPAPRARMLFTLTNYLHMLNNRLGIAILKESYLAFLAAAAVRAAQL